MPKEPQRRGSLEAGAGEEGRDEAKRMVRVTEGV